ncbi:MAG: cytochrome d ubiquinol oxidase subunit II, partial [Muribaculaceae bacterium]|nr:cytochrome d ubiquinol oxidase subunit II [Muribaculaceae bacterium]
LLQNYWWFLISVLGALLVFLLFVQGGQSMLLGIRDEMSRTLMVNLLGRKWELTFTMLVVFGGAFFASFPLFYSTSFGGAYWLWMLILFSFILQAVSYEFRRKKGNLYGTHTYDTFLFINGCAGCVLLGVAVGTMIFGAEFTITKGNLLDAGAPVISQWVPSHGLEAILSWKNLLLGFTVLFLARMQASIYLLGNVAHDREFARTQRKHLLLSGTVFILLFLSFVTVLLLSPGYFVTDGGRIVPVDYKYLTNYVDMWWCALVFVIGVVLVLIGFGATLFVKSFRHGIWYTGIGTVLVVMTLFWVIGYNNTAYYPSLIDPASSLTIRNSSSSQFTLYVMTVVSALVPFVAAYIAYVWFKMDRKPLTPEEVKRDHAY